MLSLRDDPTHVPLIEHASRVEFAGGVTGKLNPRLSVYTQAGYQLAVGPGNTHRDGVKGAGYRITW